MARLPPPSHAEAMDALHTAYRCILKVLSLRLGKRTRSKLERIRDRIADILIRNDGKGDD